MTNEKRRVCLSVLLSVCTILIALLAQVALSDTPLGSIVIYGSNGTYISSSRNVFLNLSYSSSDGISSCRWANDVESNLASSAWEECTTIKPWLLSEAFGNKTVYFQVIDTLGHSVILNDSILYQFMQDFTPPSSPIVYDGRGGTDVDWSMSNTTLSGRWFNATEDISTLYYKYRVLDNGACYSGECAWIDAGLSTYITVGGLTLVEGRNYSFEVISYNPSNLNSSSYISDGVNVDITSPAAPFVTSTTHPDQAMPYDLTTVLFNFTAIDPTSGGVASGIDGYSYLLDKYPGTSPPNTLAERYWETLAKMKKSSYNQTIKSNGTGDAYAVFSQLHKNMTVNDVLTVKVALAEQLSDYSDLMGVKVYIAKVSEGSSIAGFNLESGAISSIATITQDIRYAYQMTSAKVYLFNLTVNETIDDATNDVYVVVSGSASDDNNRNLLAIAGTTNSAQVDASTRNFACAETGPCLENTTTLEYAIEVLRKDSGASWSVQYDHLADAVYYFHVKAKDVAGNWGESSHYKITIAAGGVESMIYSPVDGELFTASGLAYNTTVRVTVSGEADVYVVAEHWDGGNFTSVSEIFDKKYDFDDVLLELGTNRLYAVANASGVVTHSADVFVTVSPVLQAATNKTMRVSYAGCEGSEVYICNIDESGVYVGVATETYGAVSAPSVQTDTSLNTIKIYMTKPFIVNELATQLAANSFLDRVNPLFGYKKGASDYLLRQEIRYREIYLGGDFFVPAGVYKLYIIKGGTTPDGAYNITLVIG